MTTTADAFFNDPRIAQARKLVLEALHEHQGKLTGPRPPRDELRESYENAVELFGQARGGSLYYRYLGSGLGNGALVELADGSVKYDMISGIGVHVWGHSSGAMIEAGFAAALRDTVMQGNLQQNAESAELSERLIEIANASGGAAQTAPTRLSHCFLTTSGAMANENALKLVFQKHHPADRVLAFTDCFAGRSTTLAQITDRAKYREGLPTTLAVDYVPFLRADDAQRSTEHAVNVISRHIARHPGKHAAMIFELIQGEGGYWAGQRDFFIALINTLKAAGIAIWIDEIQTFGRTTHPFAFQHYGLDEYVDIVTIGKMTQVCATLFRDEYTPKPGLMSQTFTGATSSIFAARAIIEGLMTGGFFGPDGRIAKIHERFAGRLQAIADRNPGTLAGPFGFGGMIAFTPLDGSGPAATKIAHALYDAGVIAFIAGSNPARVRMLPPLGVITDEQIDDVCRIIEQTLIEQSNKATKQQSDK